MFGIRYDCKLDISSGPFQYGINEMRSLRSDEWDVPPTHYLSSPVHPPYLLPLLPRYLLVHRRKHTILLPSYRPSPLPRVEWGTSGGPYLFIS